MATSGNIDANENRNDLVQGALRILGQLAEGEEATAQQVQDGETALNRMIKAWQAQGIHLWKYREATLFLQPSQNSYTIGGTTVVDHATETYYDTELAVAAVATDLTITVDDASDISDGDYIGIELDSGSIHWTTVNGAPAGAVVTITDAMPSGAAIDNDVFNYTTPIPRPEQVMNPRRRDSNNQDTPIRTISRQEYFSQPNKTSTGKAVDLYYDRQLLNGTIYLWPSPDSISEKILFTYLTPFEIFDSAADDPDFPQEWLEPIVFNLAVRLAPEYGMPLDERQVLKVQADEYLFAALKWDRENTQSISLQPDFDGFGESDSVNGSD